MDTTNIIDSDPGKLTAPLPFTPQTLWSESIQPSSHAPLSAASGDGELTGPQEASTSDPASTGGADGDNKPPLEQTRRERKERNINRGDQRRNWLMADPEEWVGRKIRSQRNSVIYTVNQVYKTGRVRLERNWMMYLTDVETVRTQYETYC